MYAGTSIRQIIGFVSVFSLGGLLCSASEIPVADAIAMIDAVASSYGDSGFQATFIQTTRRPPATEKEIEERTARQNQLWNPHGVASVEARLTQGVRERAAIRELRLIKVRAWRQADFQRLDQVFAEPGSMEELLQRPFSEGFTFINQGRQKGSYEIYHPRKTIIYDPDSKWKYKDDLLDFVMPLRAPAITLDLAQKLSAAKGSDIIITKDTARSDETSDCISITNGGANAVRNDFHFVWDERGPYISRWEVSNGQKTLLLKKYQKYEYEPNLGRMLPKRLVALKNDPATGELVREDAYGILDLVCLDNVRERCLDLLKNECASFDIERVSGNSVIKVGSLSEILPSD